MQRILKKAWKVKGMKKIQITESRLVGAAAFLLIFVIITLSSVNCKKVSKLNSEVRAINDAVAAMAEDSGTVFDEALFVVREKDGKVAIFDYRTGKVVEELNVYTYSLPQTDRTCLENGIMIYSVSDLVSLIEDYTD